MGLGTRRGGSGGMDDGGVQQDAPQSPASCHEMATKRDNWFPSTSIGRSQASSSSDVLSAHPLLSSPTVSSTSLATPPSPDTTQPRYVPYTPRQRVASATTGMTVHSSVSVSPQQHLGGATGKLQLMNLKAAAQHVGLEAASVGWAIVEALIESDHSTEWNEIWSAITTGKASLLLPLEQSHERITTEFIRDHIVLCDGYSRNSAPIVTLSGLRGVLVGDTLTLRSSLDTSLKPFEALLSPTTRASTLNGLPPLPLTPPNVYPTFSVPSHTTSLPIPPRTAGPSKPPLPPRPGSRPSSSSSRITNPFASLFGKPATPTSRPSTPPPPAATLLPDSDHVIEVSAFTLSRRIVRKDVGREITKAIRGEIKDALTGLPSSIVEHVQNFAVSLYPLAKTPKKPVQAPENGSPPPTPYSVSTALEGPERTAERFQDLYAVLEDELRAGRRRDELAGEGDGGESEGEALERIERVLCSLFYDRLFMQPTCDDASHDEALTSRIAALNMLDLGLEHLDVDIGNAGTEVDVVIRACGETLTQLEAACRAPADKAAVLVAAHKVVVDGLSKLPPVRLKSEGDEDQDQAAPEVKAAHEKDRASEGGVALADQTQQQEHPAVKSDVPTPSSPIVVPTLHTPDADVDADTGIDVDAGITSAKASPHECHSPLRPASPLLILSPPPHTTPVSGDVLLPLLIFAVVKTNPPRLLSHLLFTQRFRNQSVGGEEAYCLVNLIAVAEFLENVDLGALGLGSSEQKVISTADLTPIPIRTSLESPTIPADGLPASLRGRMEQQVDALAGSANKVFSGVVDTSFGVLRSLLPGTLPTDASAVVTSPVTNANTLQESAPWNVVRPGFGLLRRESGFSIAGLAAALPVPGARERARSVGGGEEGGQQLVAVSSRPGSVKSAHGGSAYGGSDDEGEDGDEEEEGDDDDDEDEDDDGEEDEEGAHDARSIRSFESMMSASGKRKERKSLSDRLAHMSGLSRSRVGTLEAYRDSPPLSRRTSLLPPVPLAASTRFDIPHSQQSSRGPSPSPSPSPPTVPLPGTTPPLSVQVPVLLAPVPPTHTSGTHTRIAPPVERFMECDEADLRVSEVGALLREYRRLVEDVRAVGGFEGE